jgi:urease accessory protein
LITASVGLNSDSEDGEDGEDGEEAMVFLDAALGQGTIEPRSEPRGQFGGLDVAADDQRAGGLQRTHLALADDARIEWLPLETICYSGCRAENRLTLELAPHAQVMGWDVTALGLPHADLPFVDGFVQQHIELPGVWLERGRVGADDALLLNGPAALAGMRCWATMYLVCGQAMDRAYKATALDTARDVIAAHALAATAGATSPNTQTVVVRVVAPQVEAVMGLLRQVRLAWRVQLWNMAASSPRIWAM